MRVSFESRGGFENVTRWLNKISNTDPANALNSIARDGTQSLAANTPKQTGETAAGWKEKVTVKGNVGEISWYNSAHPELSVNLAKLIELGHGTRTGGYVPPKPYVKNAMNPIWSAIDSKVIKELIR